MWGKFPCGIVGSQQSLALTTPTPVNIVQLWVPNLELPVDEVIHGVGVLDSMFLSDLRLYDLRPIVTFQGTIKIAG